MSFASDLHRFALKVEERNRAVFVGTTVEVLRSMTEGSEITGAPGQPVDTEALKGDFYANANFPEQWKWETGTNKEYGVVVEYNLPTPSGKKFSEVQVSPVGGTGSRAATQANWDKIVDGEVAKVTAGA